MKAKIISLPKQKCLVAKRLYFCNHCGRVLLDVANYINEIGNIPDVCPCSCGLIAKKDKNSFTSSFTNYQENNNIKKEVS